MRTTQKKLRALLAEARAIAGVRTNREIFARARAFEERIQKALAPELNPVLIFGPYKDNRWGLYVLTKDLREHRLPVAASDWLGAPEQTAQALVDWCRGHAPGQRRSTGA